MEVKNLFDSAAKSEIVERLHTLTPSSRRQWGKMDVAQMLAHLQYPFKLAYGEHSLKAPFLVKLLAPALFKKSLYNDIPYRKGLPTDKTYIVTDPKEFEKEKTELLGLIGRFHENAILDLRHPVFGNMNMEQWGRSFWKHMDHHLKQFGA